MRKKVFKALSALGIAAVLALNVTVVLDDNASSYVKFGMIGQIFASGTGSGSGSSSNGYGNDLLDCEWKEREAILNAQQEPTGRYKTVKHSCTNCASNCNTNQGTCTAPELCPTGI